MYERTSKLSDVSDVDESTWHALPVVDGEANHRDLGSDRGGSGPSFVLTVQSSGREATFTLQRNVQPNP